MARRWILYLLAWVGCLVFFCAYQQWFAWLVLVAVLCLPVFSLLVSLPAMLSAKLQMEAPMEVSMGTACSLELYCRSVMPVPMWRCKVRLERPITGESWVLAEDGMLPSQHCGQLICTVEKARIYDYLGLFGLPLRGQHQKEILVRPEPVPVEELPEILNREHACSWRPKQGGGYAENHELRLYRPGDSVQQIHWKLSAKTGRLILREPLLPEKGQLSLYLQLTGTPGQIDRKMGQLLWLGQCLLERRVDAELHCLTGEGTVRLSITSPESLHDAVDQLLGSSHAGYGQESVENTAGAYVIGGGQNEA